MTSEQDSSFGDTGAEPPMGADAGAPPPSFPGFSASPGSANGSFGEDSSDGIFGRATCFDGEDNGGDDGQVDCDDSGCRGLGVCCVGRGDCCSPETTSLPAVLELAECASIDDCLSDTTRFGAPSLSDGRLVPGGDLSREAGLAFNERIDLRTHRLDLTVDFAAPSACEGCLESFAIGLIKEAPSASTVSVPTNIALLYSGGRKEVSLLIEDVVIGRWPAPSASERWTLSVQPTGNVEVRGAEMETTIFEAFSPFEASIVMFGRNLGAATSAGLTRFAAMASLCDIPREWPQRRTLDWESEPDGVGAPSIAMGDRERLAFELDGAIHVAERVGEAWQLSTQLLETEGSVGWAFEGAFDPELYYNGSSWELFFTGVSEAGPSIGVAHEVDGVWEVDSEPTLSGVEGPTIAEIEGNRVLIARRDRELVLFYESGSWIEVDKSSSLLSEATQPAVGDRLGNPSLVRHNQAWQLYVPYLRGTRWGTKLFVSDELIVWRDLGDALGGVQDGFDALGVSDVDAISGLNQVRVVYVGMDGVRRRLGEASRQSTSAGQPIP